MKRNKKASESASGQHLFKRARIFDRKHTKFFEEFGDKIDELLAEDNNLAKIKDYYLGSVAAGTKDSMEAILFAKIKEFGCDKLPRSGFGDLKFIEHVGALFDSICLSTNKFYLFCNRMMIAAIVSDNDELLLALRNKFATNNILDKVLVADSNLLQHLFAVNDGNSLSKLMPESTAGNDLRTLKEQIKQFTLEKISTINTPLLERTKSVMKYQPKRIAKGITAFFHPKEKNDHSEHKIVSKEEVNEFDFETNFFLTCLIESTLRKGHGGLLEDILTELDEPNSAKFIYSLCETKNMLSTGSTRDLTLRRQEQEKIKTEEMRKELDWLITTHNQVDYCSLSAEDSLSVASIEVEPISC